MKKMENLSDLHLWFSFNNDVDNEASGYIVEAFNDFRGKKCLKNLELSLSGTSIEAIDGYDKIMNAIAELDSL